MILCPGSMRPRSFLLNEDSVLQIEVRKRLAMQKARDLHVVCALGRGKGSNPDLLVVFLTSFLTEP